MAITTENTFLMCAPASYSLTSDTSVVAGKTYYTRSGTSPNYTYTKVVNPVTASIGTYYERSAGTYAKLVDIKNFPDLGSVPSTVDITTLTDHQKMNLLGLKDPGTLEFTANYDYVAYAALKAMTDTQYLAVWFGVGTGDVPDGHEGKFSFEGDITVFVKGAGVEAPVDMTIAAAVKTEITFA